MLHFGFVEKKLLINSIHKVKAHQYILSYVLLLYVIDINIKSNG